MLKWYDKAGKNDDVVVSSRIRLARNFSEYNFMDRLSEEDAVTMVNSVVSRFQTDYPDEYNCIYMNNCTEGKKRALKEKRVIGSYLVGAKTGAVILSADEGASVMVNAEDHIRIQALSNGMNIPACFKRANEIDDYIDSHFDYAFDEQYGYKTTFPTNVGTGMRASYTLHLPALSETKKLNQISAELGRFGIKFKMPYGDDEGGYGNLYQISTQKTLGQEEKEILKDFDNIIVQIIRQEREQRQYIYDNNITQLEDEVYKSYGVLKYARKLSLKDAMMLISEFMLGVSLGILTVNDNSKYSINRMIMDIQPAVINNAGNKARSVDETDIMRAQYIRKNCPDIISDVR